jgi:hypothetical protein
MSLLRPCSPLLVGIALLLGFNAAPAAQAQSVDEDQNAALKAAAQMTEGQRTYYQTNGKFRAEVENIQQDFGITLPATFDYAVRTTSEAAYSYVIPKDSPQKGQLKAYVGAAFLTPGQEPKITTLICENTQTGTIRPADPQLTRGLDVNDPTRLGIICGDFSTPVPASKVNE